MTMINTLTNREAELISNENDEVIIKYTDTDRNETIKKYTFERWFVVKPINQYVIEIGTNEVTITAENFEEMKTLHPEISALNLTFTVPSIVTSEVVENNSIIETSVAENNVTPIFVKIRSYILEEEAKPKKVEEYTINGTLVSVTSYTEGDWKGWITGVVINDTRYKNIKQALESIDSLHLLPDFKRFRIDTRETA